MGCNISCKRLSPSSLISPIPKKNKNIRILHLNGYVTQLDYPATVAEVAGVDQSNKHFLFTHAQMLSNTSKPLTPDTVLEAGNIYFLLPYSLFDSGVSPTDFAAVAKRLATKARNDHKSKSKKNKKNDSIGVGDSTFWSSPGNYSSSSSNNNNSPSRLLLDYEIEYDLFGSQKSSKSRSWKPELDTIREKSFNRRSESDLIHESFRLDSELSLVD